MNYNKQVEGLRGIAMLLVVAYHFFVRYSEIYAEKVLDFFPFVYGGRIGVAIFFVISGFFLYGKKNENFLTAIVCRFLKIWPAYIMAIIIIFSITHYCELPGRTVGFEEFVLNAFMINTFVGVDFVDGAHWYLSTLLVCTIWIELINHYVPDKKRTISLLAWETLILLLCSVRIPLPFFSKIKSGVFLLFGGEYVPYVVAGYCLRRYFKEKKNDSIICILISCGFVLYLQDAYCAFFVMAATILLGMCIKEVLKPLQAEVLVMLGKTSFAVYLIHQNIGYCIIRGLSLQFGYSFAIAAVTVIVTVAMGVVYYYVCVRRFQKNVSDVTRELKRVSI